jgi:hypothetical protein
MVYLARLRKINAISPQAPAAQDKRAFSGRLSAPQDALERLHTDQLRPHWHDTSLLRIQPSGASICCQVQALLPQ